MKLYFLSSAELSSKHLSRLLTKLSWGRQSLTQIILTHVRYVLDTSTMLGSTLINSNSGIILVFPVYADKRLRTDVELGLHSLIRYRRFEAVDRDLHPPMGGTSIPPQPLRPAPQPKPIARPRPSPLQAPSASESLRMQDIGPGPLTPPPQGLTSLAAGPQHRGPTSFIFPSEPPQASVYNPYKVPQEPMKYSCETSQTSSSYEFEDGQGKGFRTRSDHETFGVGGTIQQYGTGMRYPENVEFESDDESYGNHRMYSQRNARSSQVNYGSSSTAQTIMESIYGPQAASKMLQSSQNVSELCTIGSGSQSQTENAIEMTPFRNQLHNVPEGCSHPLGQNSIAKSQGLQNVSQMIQTNQAALYSLYSQNTPQDHKTISQSTSKTRGSPNISASPILSGSTLPSPVPPPAPPDPPIPGTALLRKNGPTTGERIFNALRSVTSQSYIDASEFYK